jgi:hypothetical protein
MLPRQQKLKQLERQQGRSSSQSTHGSSASDCSSPIAFALSIRPKTILKASAAEWSSRATAFSARHPAPLTAPLPSSPIIEPRTLRFSIPTPAEHIVHQEHKWGPGGLNPYTHKLPGSYLLDGITEIGDSTPSPRHTIAFDDDDVTEFFLGSPVSSPSLLVDSGYESHDSGFVRYVCLSSSRRYYLFL